jgi:peptidoglycan/LPS O-acetylase OafA/YrhL
VALGGLALVDLASPAVDLGIEGVGNWLGNLFALPSFGVPVETCTASGCHVGFGITQAWSIGVELGFYLALPWMARAAHRLATRGGRPAGPGGLLTAIAAVWLAGQGFRLFVVLAEPSWQRESLAWLPMFLDFFALGMALAVLSARFGAPGPPRVEALARHPWACWLAVVVVIGIMTRFPPPAEPFGLSSGEYLVRQFVYGIASVLWLWPAIFGDQQRTRLRRALAWRPLVYLGSISLSFYLWHVAFVAVAKSWTVPDYDARLALEANPPPGNPLAGVATFTGNALVVTLITWGLSFVVAAVLYRVVERPLLELKSRPLRPGRTPGPT